MDHLFPFMPIHRLDEEPTVRARLADLTCDSDGMVENFIDVEEVQKSLDLHPVEPERAIPSRYVSRRRLPGDPR